MPIFMAKNVRETLGPNAEKCANRNLFAAKFPDLADDDRDKGSKQRSLSRVLRIAADDGGYKSRIAFLTSLRNSGRRYSCFMATLKGRLIVNQAGGVLENAGLCLDRHFGFPFIPGSALKGIARAAASETCANDAEVLAVFGSSPGDRLPPPLQNVGFAGSVSFLPAYPVADATLAIDILTCHHPKYYSDTHISKALDTEAPIPNPFPVVEAGSNFLFVLLTITPPSTLDRIKALLRLPQDFDVLTGARNWLACGLTEHGAGAKTSAGYGWFELNLEAERKEREAAEQRRSAEEREKARLAFEKEKQEAEQKRLASMSPIDRAREHLLSMDEDQFGAFARSLGGKNADEQRAFLQILRKDKKDRWKMWKRRKPELAASISSIAGKLGEVLP